MLGSVYLLSAGAPWRERFRDMGITKLVVRGARQHNLKNINVEIPRNTLTVITGLSGSGKSSLAFDTIMPKGSDVMLNHCRPTQGNFWTRWNGRKWM